MASMGLNICKKKKGIPRSKNKKFVYVDLKIKCFIIITNIEIQTTMIFALSIKIDIFFL